MQHKQIRPALLCLTWIEVIFIIFIPHRVTGACIAGCTCTQPGSRPSADITASVPRTKVSCHPTPKFTSLLHLEFTMVASAVQLDLSKNSLTVIRRAAFQQLPLLEKLDLSNNLINVIEPEAFLNLTKLQKLDLSENRLTSVNRSMFQGLVRLERLSLSKNQLTTVPDGTFAPLPLLKKVDFQSDKLVCDCHLSWIIRWMKTSNVVVKQSTTCSFPKPMKDRSIKTLKKKELHCGWPVELPLFEMVPASSQVVFQGDKLPFECRASVLDTSTQINWVRNGHAVQSNRTAGIYVHTQYSPDRKIVVNSLVLERLSLNNSGIWQCLVQTAAGNVTQNVNIIVISKQSSFCAAIDTDTNKGFYSWPKTVSGVIVALPCQMGPAVRYLGHAPPNAIFRCSAGGIWQNLDVTQCQFRNEMTRVLEQYTMMNLNNLTNIESKAKKLKSYVTNARVIKDKMDVIFLSQIIEKFSKQVSRHPELADIIIDLVSRMMDTDNHLLKQAQVDDHACSRMVKAVEDIPKQLLLSKRSVSIHTSNIVMEAHEVEPQEFPGMTCTVFYKPGVSKYDSSNSLKCNTNSNSSKSAVRATQQVYTEKQVEASIRIPASIFRNVHCLYGVCGPSFKLQFFVYRNAKLFPSSTLNRIITTPVISSKIAEVPVNNLTDKIMIQLRSRSPGTDYQAGHWDFTAYGGQGDWVTTGCRIIYHVASLSTIHCNHLTNFAVLQRSVMVKHLVYGVDWLVLFHLEPIVYVGSGVCMVCLLAVIITYITSHRHIVIPKKMKHSVVNVCISILLLVVTFPLGIHVYMAFSTLHCQIVGIALHYFSLCTLFWLTVTTSNMYKKFTKVDRPSTDPPPDALNPMPPKPMLRFYLLGWGVPIIICGITAAVDIEHYTSSEYCFLLWEPSLGAFYGPVGLLVLINIFLFLRLFCVLRGSPYGIDETETEEINVIELSGPEHGSLAHTNRTSATSSSSLMDSTYRPITQMRAVVMILFLYMLMWTCAAFTVADPFPSLFPQRELIFSYAYGFTSSLLGIFVLVFFCLGRPDARTAWQRVFCCEKRHAVYDVNTTNHMTHANGHVIQSASSLDSSFTNKSNNTNKSNSYKNYHPKQTNINILPLQALAMNEPSLTSIQENFPSFYNPRQNGVAKKFWEKSRQRNGRKLINKNINIDSGHSSQGDGRSQSDAKRNSYGNNSSDGGNTHRSGELKNNLCLDPVVNHVNGPLSVQTNLPLPMTPAELNHLGARNVQGHRSPGGVLVDPLRLSPAGITFDRNHISPVGVIVDPIMENTGIVGMDHDKISPYGGHPTAFMPQLSPQAQDGQAPEHTNTNYAHMHTSRAPYVLPPPPKPSYPVFRSNTLPHPTRPPSSTTVSIESKQRNGSVPRLNEYMQRNGSVPRLRDFDGQSQVSQENRPVSGNNSVTAGHVAGGHETDNLPYLLPMWSHMLSEGSHPTSAEVDSGMACQNTSNNNINNRLSQCSQDSRHTATDSGKTASQENSRHQKKRNSKRDSFMEQLERRIPHNNRPNSPSASDSQAQWDKSEIQPLRHKRRHKSHDSYSHRHHRKRHSRNMSKSSSNSKNWEDEFQDHAPKISYAYVNHRYQQKLMQKFHHQQNVNGYVDPASKGFWFPRSVSAYEQVANDILSNLDDDDDSVTSSDGSEDDIWVPQRDKLKKKQKKETSV